MGLLQGGVQILPRLVLVTLGSGSMKLVAAD